MAVDLLVALGIYGGGGGGILAGIGWLRHRVRTLPDRIEDQWRSTRSRYRIKAVEAEAECRKWAKRYGNANDYTSRAVMLNAADVYRKLGELWSDDNFPRPPERTLLPAPTKIVEDTPKEMR